MFMGLNQEINEFMGLFMFWMIVIRLMVTFFQYLIFIIQRTIKLMNYNKKFMERLKNLHYQKFRQKYINDSNFAKISAYFKSQKLINFIIIKQLQIYKYKFKKKTKSIIKMYNPSSQNFPLTQFNNNNYFLCIANNINQYTSSFTNPNNGIKLDKKQQMLYLKIIQMFVSDDKLMSDYCWNWELQDKGNQDINMNDNNGNGNNNANVEVQNINNKQQIGKQNISSIQPKNIQSKNCQKQSNKIQQINKFPHTPPKQQLGNFAIKYTKNSSLKSFLKQFKLNINNNQLNNTYGLQGKSGLLKLQSVMSTIIQHCDNNNQTKNIHKVLYLVFKYLQMRLKYKQVGVVQKNRNHRNHSGKNNLKNKTKYSAVNDLFDWLGDASNLFSQQLQHPPLTGQLASRRHQQHNNNKNQNRTIYKIAQKQKQQLSSPNKQSNPQHSHHSQHSHPNSIQLIQSNTLKQSYFQLQKTNKYFYLLKMVQNYQLQNLSYNLQQLILQINQQYDQQLQQNTQDIYKMRNQLILRIQSIISIITHHIDIDKSNIKIDKKQLSQFYRKKHDNSALQFYKYFDSKLPSTSSPILNLNQQKKFNKMIESHQNYFKLITILKYIVSIMFGNSRVISNYVGNNIYMYLRLYIKYIQPNQSQNYSNNNNSQQQQQFKFQKCKQIIIKYLQQLHTIQITKQQSQIKINPIHNYLLLLINKKLIYQVFPNSSVYLQTHKMIQQSFVIFQGYQFYAYLIASIMFSLGFVQKQLYELDQEYQSNMIRGLLMAATQDIKDQRVYGSRRDDKREREDIDQRYRQRMIRQQSSDSGNNSMQYDYQDLQQKHRNNMQFGSSQNNSLMFSQSPIFPKLNMLSSQSHRIAIPSKSYSTPLTTQKLLFSTISFYKNILYKPSLLKQHNLLYPQTKNLPAQNYFNQNYHIPPLNQLIQNLILSNMEYKVVNNFHEIKQLYYLSKYVCRVGVQEYFMEWIRHVVRISVQENTLIYEEQQKNVGNYIGGNEYIQKNNQDQNNYSNNQNNYQQNYQPLNQSQPHLHHSLTNTNNNNNILSFHPIDQYILQLMILQIRLSICSNPQIHKWTQYNENPHYGTQSFNLLYFTQYLTISTLHQPFNYTILKKVQELSGINSQLSKINKNVSKQFYNCFQIFFMLDSIKNKINKNKIEISNGGNNNNNINKIKQKIRKQNKINLISLTQISNCIDIMINIYNINNIQCCGEVLRVTWQILHQYQQIKNQTHKQILQSGEQQQMLEKVGDKLVNFVGELKHYVEMMLVQGYVNQEVNRFKGMLF